MYGTDLIWRSIRANTTSVAAAPLPKPDEPAEPISDADGWALLEGLRRRLDEHAAQGRKTQAQVTQLAESIAALVAEQRRRSLWLNVNSFVAYLVFTLLCAAGCYLLYRSRARELGAARDQAVSERDLAVRRADEALARAVAREAADTKAWEIYQLLEVGQRAEAMAKLDALRDQPLSRLDRTVLTTRIRDAQVTELDAALRSAAAAIKAGRPGEVVKPLEAALASEPSGPRAAMMHYYLGVGYARTEPDKAVTHLEAAIAGEVEQDDARFQLASVLDRSGAYVQARAEYDRFATAHPQSPFAVFALRRSATLSRLPAAVPASAPEPASPGPAASLAAGAPAASGTPGAAGTPPAAAAPPGPAPGGALAAPAGGPGAPRPLRAWPKPWPKPPAKSAGSAAPPSDSPADRAAEPSPE
jgi:tetratricopeptide (TPR) repeat protein